MYYTTVLSHTELALTVRLFYICIFSPCITGTIEYSRISVIKCLSSQSKCQSHLPLHTQY